MLEITSTGCGKFHHAQFRLRFDDHAAVERDARELVARLERRVAAGASFQDGDHFPCGWVQLRFRQIEEKLLAVHEPDFQSLPIRYKDSVTQSLRHSQWQSACATMLGLDGAPAVPAMTQTAALCPRVENGETLFMERQNASSSNSGWIIGCAEPIHDHVHSSEMLRAPLYEIVTRLDTTVAAFLGLPPGAKVLKRPHGLWVSCHGRSHRIRRNSFLGHLMETKRDGQTALVSMDDSHNLLRWPPGQQIPCYLIPAAGRLTVTCERQSVVPAPAEIIALGVREPNTAVLLTRDLQWRESWTAGQGAEFDLTKTPQPAGPKSGTESNGAESRLVPGEELILIVGYSDSGPHSITHGGIAAMWSARLKVA